MNVFENGVRCADDTAAGVIPTSGFRAAWCFDAPGASGKMIFLWGMGMFKVNVVARNPKQEELETPPVEALVDTGSELTWIPGEILQSVGITPRRKRIFAAAVGHRFVVTATIVAAKVCHAKHVVAD